MPWWAEETSFKNIYNFYQFYHSNFLFFENSKNFYS